MRLIDADRLKEVFKRNTGYDYADIIDMQPTLSVNPQEPNLNKIRAEIDRQEKWLLQAGYTAYNIDIAFDSIKNVIAESEDEE